MSAHLIQNRAFLLFGFLAILFLSGCGASFRPSQQDGPPKRIPKNIHKTPDAVPKVEPLSRHGNRYGKSPFHNSYVAHKKRHHVMKTSKGYKARGIASWYGTRFHGRKTANGEHYNMFAMTAAHKTLPLPTYVKVTHLKNHKSVIVRVNDRGPFSENRIIDLSYAAATKLGVLGHGTAHVEVVSVDPRDHKHRPKHSHTPKSHHPEATHCPKKPTAQQNAREKYSRPQTGISRKKHSIQNNTQITERKTRRTPSKTQPVQKAPVQRR